MSRPKVVIADNDLDYLVTLKEYLQRAGLEVFTATTPAEAMEVLGKPDIALAMLDVCLESDDDLNDITGLLLAAESAFLYIPKIILTSFPERARENLNRNMVGKLPLYVDFIDKAEERERILDAVIRVLAGRIHPPQTANISAPSPENRKVFVVHGHDEAAREKVARLIEKMGLTAIILIELTAGGKTIIEALEANSEVSFAIVVLTPDDFGGAKKAQDKVQDRARQNVIFEMGYFIGKLTRKRVHAILKDGVELPSDLGGILFTPLDPAGAWRTKLGKELKEAGFDIDLNKI